MTKKENENGDLIYMQTDDKKNKVQKTNKVTLTFKSNRSFDLHIGRITHRFNGRETKSFPSSILGHPDFTETIQKYFVIKEL